MTILNFHRVNLSSIFLLTSKCLCLSKTLEASKVSLSEEITAGQKTWQSNFSRNITSNDICRLPKRQHAQSSYSSIFEILSYPSKCLCLSKVLKPCKLNPSEEITAEQKIWKSVFAKNITSNDFFRLPERQPTQSSSFSIFEIFVLSIKAFMIQ